MHIKFCEYCHNIMSTLSVNNQLYRQCSIECEPSKTAQIEPKPTSIIVLSETLDTQQPQQQQNKNIIYDPTILRFRCAQICKAADCNSNEMLVVKNSKGQSYFICSKCQLKYTEKEGQSCIIGS